MSQVTEHSVRFQTALASIKLIQASAVLDLTENDFDFLTSNIVWIATDLSDARRCDEACVRSEERRVGEERRSRWSPHHYIRKARHSISDVRIAERLTCRLRGRGVS